MSAYLPGLIASMFLALNGAIDGWVAHCASVGLLTAVEMAGNRRTDGERR